MKLAKFSGGFNQKKWLSISIFVCGLLLCIAGESWGQSRNNAKLEERKVEARKVFEEFETAYLTNDWKKVGELKGKMRGLSKYLKPNEKQAVLKAMSYDKIFRPNWWKKAANSTPVSFKVSMWERNFTANYVPDEQVVGKQMYLSRVQNGQLKEIIPVVSWRPQYIGSKTPAVGGLAVKHKLTMGDYVEVIVRHELGHNYITNQLPAKGVLELLQRHSWTFSVLQEFYADLTALRHSTPKAMRIVCWARLNEMDLGNHQIPHMRASMGIGFVLLHEFLSHPDKWPSIHFPKEVPDGDVLLNTLKYVYSHWDKEWTLIEDIQLREYISKYIRANGQKVFKARGTIKMKGASFGMLLANDRELKETREKWLRKQLEKIIKSERADDEVPDEGQVMRLMPPYEASELERMRREALSKKK
ncbi:hypothetical protein JD969_15270 [Planctomycetota bacterium]|nr:hypothetical protein JD969_15270 [Planctomycetota bacterium]